MKQQTQSHPLSTGLLLLGGVFLRAAVFESYGVIRTEKWLGAYLFVDYRGNRSRSDWTRTVPIMRVLVTDPLNSQSTLAQSKGEFKNSFTLQNVLKNAERGVMCET